MKTPILQPIFRRHDKRGSFFELFNGIIWKNIIFGTMRKNSVMGNHYHKRTKVFFYILRGKAQVENIHVRTKESERLYLSASQGVIFDPFVSHMITFIQPSMFLMGKSRTYSKISSDTYNYPVHPQT